MERRSGSNSCLLEPKYSFCNEDGHHDAQGPLQTEQAGTITSEEKPAPLSVTVIHHEKLPTYSTERFYMLSEMEQKARSILFLSDFTDDHTATTTSSEDSVSGAAAASSSANPFPSYLVLYILWRPDNSSISVTDFIDGYIEEPVKQLQTLAKREDGEDISLPQIYVVVDTLVPNASPEADDVVTSDGGVEDDGWPDDWEDASREFQQEEKARERLDQAESNRTTIKSISSTNSPEAGTTSDNKDDDKRTVKSKQDRATVMGENVVEPSKTLSAFDPTETEADGKPKRCQRGISAAELSDVFMLNDLDTTDRTDAEESDDSAEEQSIDVARTVVRTVGEGESDRQGDDDVDDNDHQDQLFDDALDRSVTGEAVNEGTSHEDGLCDDSMINNRRRLLSHADSVRLLSHADSMHRLPIASNSPAALAGEMQGAERKVLDDAPEWRVRQHEAQVEIAEQLAKKVSQSTSLRAGLAGITVGVVDHVRAAPGLEACLDAVTFGATARRRAESVENESERKSLIGIVGQTTEDMVGLGNGETDAVQGVFQSRVSAEWSGKGNLESFAKRAHENWCRQQGIPLEEPSSPRRRRLSNIYSQSHADEGDPAIQLLAIIFIALLAYLWMYMNKLNEEQ